MKETNPMPVANATLPFYYFVTDHSQKATVYVVIDAAGQYAERWDMNPSDPPRPLVCDKSISSLGAIRCSDRGGIKLDITAKDIAYELMLRRQEEAGIQ